MSERTRNCLVLLPLFVLFVVNAYSDTSRPPNFVIIMADDLGYNGTSIYDGWVKTPNLERLAKQGMTFTDFHSSGVVCSPTRAGFLTGRYQERAGIPGVVYAAEDRAEHYTGLQTSEITFPELLSEKEYATALMGKWHLGYFPKYNPLHHGFDEFRGFVSGNVDYLSHYDQAGNYDWWNGLEQVEEEGYTTHLINEHSLDFIRHNKDNLFCLYIAHEAPHYPLQGPNSQIERGPLAGERANAVELSDDEIYLEMMSALDDSVGDVLDLLESLELSDNTLVFFFSDNGHAYEGPADHARKLRGKKGQVWEGGHRVPAIASWPGRIPTDTRNDGLFISLDIMPTLLELADVPVPQGHRLDGVTMTSALLSAEAPKDRKIFWRGQAMRDGPWKWVDTKEGGLFNLVNDLGEEHDLRDQYPERVAEMQKALKEWRADVSEGATVQPKPPEGDRRITR